MQLAQERVLTEKMTSFEETVTTLRGESKAMQKAIAELEARHKEEISSLQETIRSQGLTVKSLQSSTAQAKAQMSRLQDQISQIEADNTTLQHGTNRAEARMSQLQADNNVLQDEIAELHQQLGHAEDFSIEAGMRAFP